MSLVSFQLNKKKILYCIKAYVFNVKNVLLSKLLSFYFFIIKKTINIRKNIHFFILI